jgi:hypothetical protein
MNIYLELTNQFNHGRLRSIISSGQAVVLHRLAIMSKDGDWIILEDTETTKHIISVLERFGARYRFGAPLDSRWLAGGWSSHFEFMHNDMRIRTDFVARPPRISHERLEKIWREQRTRKIPFVDLHDLAELKKTNREKDYAILGELARRMIPSLGLRYSRSARELITQYRKNSKKVVTILNERGIPLEATTSVETMEIALDAERRRLIHLNEHRLSRYTEAAQEWAKRWKGVEKKIAGMPLSQAHEYIIEQAEPILPVNLNGTFSLGSDPR